MSPLEIGVLIGIVTIVVLASGIPIAFGLGLVAIGFLFAFEGWSGLGVMADSVFSGLASFTLASIPLFVIMGAAVASSPAGKDVYVALERWLYRVPGGLVAANLGACAIFSALTGSSPATCAAIGRMGIPEMRQRGYPAGLATGAIAAGGTLGILIPPSVTLIIYGIATETSIARLFMAGVIPGLMLTGLFMAWAIFFTWRRGGFGMVKQQFSLKERFESLPKVIPFLLVIIVVLYTLYGGVATPSEAAGVGALFCLLLAIVIYRMWQPRKIYSILNDSMRESVMILMIIGVAELFSYMLSSLFVTQSIAEWIAALEVNRWVLLFIINIFLLVAGFFLPPVAIILMAVPILVPLILQSGFDPYWFAIIMTINMELGLVTPPVGLNLFVINGICPDVKLPTILWGTVPFMLCMVLAIVLLCIFPGIATWLPNYLMGPELY